MAGDSVMAMSRLFGVFVLGVMVSLGCADVGVGDPCAPSRPGNAPCVPGGAMPSPAQTAGCFQGTEIYLETQSLQCRSRICLVYRYAEATDNTQTQRPKRVYCTCRCGVPQNLAATTDSSVLCTCPEGFICLTNLAGPQYAPNVQGSYCIRSGT
jgi:hypothetical protein